MAKRLNPIEQRIVDKRQTERLKITLLILLIPILVAGALFADYQYRKSIVKVAIEESLQADAKLVRPEIELAEAGENESTTEDSIDADSNEPINVGGVPRSGKWPSVRKDWLLQYPCCEACGKESMSNHVHHRFPFHLHPEWELLDYLPDGRRQFVTVCADHHFMICHDGDGLDGPQSPKWTEANAECIEDCAKWRKKHHLTNDLEIAPIRK